MVGSDGSIGCYGVDSEDGSVHRIPLEVDLSTEPLWGDRNNKSIYKRGEAASFCAWVPQEVFILFVRACTSLLNKCTHLRLYFIEHYFCCFENVIPLTPVATLRSKGWHYCHYCHFTSKHPEAWRCLETSKWDT